MTQPHIARVLAPSRLHVQTCSLRLARPGRQKFEARAAAADTVKAQSAAALIPATMQWHPKKRFAVRQAQHQCRCRWWHGQRPTSGVMAVRRYWPSCSSAAKLRRPQVSSAQPVAATCVPLKACVTGESRSPRQPPADQVWSCAPRAPKSARAKDCTCPGLRA